jgi:FkbM family methyltransferase
LSLIGSNLAALKEKWLFLEGHPAYRRSPAQVMFRLLRWRLHCFLKAPAIVELPPYGVRLFLPPHWRGIGKLIFAFRENYEPELSCLSEYLSEGSIFVDVGANLGIYTVAAARRVGESGRVISFEPASNTFSILQRNITLNHLNNVIATQLALADKEGTRSLFYHVDASRHSLAENESIGFETITTIGLDTFLSRNQIVRVNLMKIDVEGAEELVLRGAVEVLEKSRPVIVFEINSLLSLRLGLKPDGALTLLSRLGYSFYKIDRFGKLRAVVPDLSRVDNIVAIHRRDANTKYP